MSWEEAVWKVVVALLVLALGALGKTVLNLWKGFNPGRLERHYKLMSESGKTLTQHTQRLGVLEERMQETRGQGERITRLESDVSHIKGTTGEMRLDIKELLLLARANGG